MIFGNIFTNQNSEIKQVIDLNGTTNLDNASQKLLEYIKALMPGEVIQGAILSREGSNVQLEINNQFYLQAQMEESLPLEIGKTLSFQVSNDGNKLALTPLFSNLATEEMAIQALKVANVPASDENLQLIKHMMEGGLSIQKDQILNLVKELNLHPNLDPKTLVQMQKLEIPITNTTVEQAINYQNGNYQVELGINQILGEVEQLLTNVLKENGGTNVGTFLQQVASTLDTPFEIPLNTLPSVETSTDVGVGLGDKNDFLSQLKANLMQIPNSMEGQNQGVIPKESTDGIIFLQDKINDLMKLLQMQGSGNSQLVSTLEGSLMEVKDDIMYALKLGFLEQFALKSGQLKEEKVTTNLYEKLQSSLSQIGDAALQLVGKENPITQSSMALSQNIDFMNQLNQVFQFVQLPMKLDGSEAHADLYVYTNKKNLAEEEGKISAFLHLDMDNIGGVDIHVTLENKNVTTNFQVENETILEFLNQHMDSLDARLQKKGYLLKVEATVREGTANSDQNGVLDELLKETNGKHLVSNRSFDVRA